MTSARNLALYPIYVVCLNGFFWFPVFFLYLIDCVGLEGALLLEAIYYLAVVVFEVPSGWASDRLGRRFALRCAALLLTAAYIAFYATSTMAGLAFAQILLAAGFAFNSGTDTAFHYDTLVATGQQDEFADREERIARLSFAVVGIAALTGGLAGSVELRLPYLIAALTMAVGFIVTLAFVPPEQQNAAQAERIDRQILACIGDLRNPVLAWLFAASVLLTVLIHVPYQLYQPYLDALDLQLLPGTTPTPAVTGVHAFAAMMVASAISARSVWLSRRIGLRATVLSGLGLGLAVVLGIAVALHPLIALLLVFRSGSRGMMQAPLNAEIAPRIPQERRASYLSVQSLAGRLAFSALLFALSAVVGEATGYSEIARTALISGALGGFALLILVITSGPAAREVRRSTR